MADRTTPVPACSSPAAEIIERVHKLRRLAGDALIESQRTASGALIRLHATPEIEAGVQEFTTWEATCCPFLELHINTNSTEIQIDINAPHDADTLMDLLVAAITPQAKS